MINSLILKHKIARTAARRVARFGRKMLRCPDAWHDIQSFLISQPEVVYIDVGAHIGITVDRILDECSNKVCAFEPTPESFAQLRRRTNRKKNFRCFNLGLTDSSGEAPFFINKNEQTNSILDNDKINEESLSSFTAHRSIVTIKTTTFDEWVECEKAHNATFFMKLDVQGAELRVLVGAMKSLPQIAGLYVECPLAPMYKGQATFWEINQFLENHGYILRNIYPCLRDLSGRAIQTDALWTRY
jgi:FkbM family methyltransferase